MKGQTEEKERRGRRRYEAPKIRREQVFERATAACQRLPDECEPRETRNS